MNDFWWMLVLAIECATFSKLCAIFSKQMDKALAKLILNEKKRVVACFINGVISLLIIGVLIFKVTSAFAGDWSIILMAAPLAIFFVVA